LHLYYGIGMRADAVRARACFERALTKEGACNAESPSMDRVFLSVMLLDAQGGRRETDRAVSLFDGCFEDQTVQQVRDEAHKRAHGANKRLDFCKDIGGTMGAMDDCAQNNYERALMRRQVVAWPMVSKLDGRQRALWVAAANAWTEASLRTAQASEALSRGGAVLRLDDDASASASQIVPSLMFVPLGALKEFSLPSMAPLEIIEDMAASEDERLKRIVQIPSYRPNALADVDKAESEMAQALATAMPSVERDAGAGSDLDDKDVSEATKALINGSQVAWVAYRDAEVELYIALYGDRFGRAPVERDARASLARARATSLRALRVPP
jgi:uncharacterized protein YecT (DUF1311 family)